MRTLKALRCAVTMPLILMALVFPLLDPVMSSWSINHKLACSPSAHGYLLANNYGQGLVNTVNYSPRPTPHDKARSSSSERTTWSMEMFSKNHSSCPFNSASSLPQFPRIARDVSSSSNFEKLLRKQMRGKGKASAPPMTYSIFNYVHLIFLFPTILSHLYYCGCTGIV